MIDTVPVGAFTIQMAVHPSGVLVYVPDAENDAVSVLYTATNTVVATWAAGPFPFGVAIHPSDDAVAYVTNFLGDTITVVGLTTNTVIDTITVDPGPVSIAFDTDGTTMYVNSFNNDSIAVIDTATRLVIDTIPTGSGPVDLIVTPTEPCPADANGDGTVDPLDSGFVLARFGECP